MATRWMPRLLLVLMVSSRICVSTPMAADEVALLAIKAAAVPGGYGNSNTLASWNKLQADDKAGWEFITCLSNCSQLQQLTIDGSPGLTGQVPSQIGNLSTTLQVLLLDDTRISRTIPSVIGNLAGLQVLSLANTSITGVIPESIGKLGNLGVLHLYNTGLSGSIPSSIGNLSNLFQLSAYNSSLEGAIPPSLGKLMNLQSLDLLMNRLNGSIPIEIFRLPIISKYLNLSHNLLSGFLPSEVGKLSNLNILDLSENKLSGGIPDSIGECIVLQGLWLENNSFEGSIKHTSVSEQYKGSDNTQSIHE